MTDDPKPPVPKVLIFSTFPLPDWIMQHIDFGGAETHTYGEFITRYASSEPEMQELTERWRKIDQSVIVGVGADFGEIEGRVLGWLQGRADEVLSLGKPYTYDDHRPKGDARELIKEMPVSDGKRQFTPSRREQLAQQRRDARKRR